MAQSSIEQLKRRAAAMLNQAANAANEHEKRVFQSKAFTLMAEYGLSEAELRVMTRDPGKVVNRKIEFSGQYNKAQCHLMHALARALHCESTHKTNYSHGSVFGVESHVQRVEILFVLLRDQLLKEMAATQPWQAEGDGWNLGWYSPGKKAAIVREHRRGFGIGFAGEIECRLGLAEREVIRTAEERADSNAAALVLMSDHEKAKKALDLHYQDRKLRVAKVKSADAGYSEGREAGRRADISGDRTLAPKIAIGA